MESFFYSDKCTLNEHTCHNPVKINDEIDYNRWSACTNSFQHQPHPHQNRLTLWAMLHSEATAVRYVWKDGKMKSAVSCKIGKQAIEKRSNVVQHVLQSWLLKVNATCCDGSLTSMLHHHVRIKSEEHWWKLMNIDENRWIMMKSAWKLMKWLSLSSLWQNLANGQVLPGIKKKSAIC